MSHLKDGGKNDIHKQLEDILLGKQWCLDFDMDFYSTQNPFLSLLGSQFEFIDEIFKFRDFGDLQTNLDHRKTQLSCLKYLCSRDNRDQNNGNLSENELKFLESLKTKYPNLQESISQAKLHAKDDEFINDLFYIGQQTELPHHVSTETEINILLSRTEKLLSCLRTQPEAISLARSEYDEYSAQDTLDSVHCKLVCMLKRLYAVESTLECPKLLS